MSNKAISDRSDLATTAREHPLILWLITDNKPGHRNQLEGLRLAFERQGDIQTHWLNARAPGQSLLDWGLGRFPPGSALPKPDLIVVAGHRTHLCGLAARRARGGRLVTLMRPSLPTGFFDACVIPLHDDAPVGEHILRTRGVLNPMRPGVKVPGSAAILVGGISRHYRWDDDAVAQAIETLLDRWPQALVTDSRRTPASLRGRLAARAGGRYQAWEDCPPGWLATTLACTETAWITADSVSMVYEALTAGCATGLIELAPATEKPGKIAAGLAKLEHDRLIVTLSDLLASGTLPSQPATPLAEADRVAAQLLALASTSST